MSNANPVYSLKRLHREKGKHSDAELPKEGATQKSKYQESTEAVNTELALVG